MSAPQPLSALLRPSKKRRQARIAMTAMSLMRRKPWCKSWRKTRPSCASARRKPLPQSLFPALRPPQVRTKKTSAVLSCASSKQVGLSAPVKSRHSPSLRWSRAPNLVLRTRRRHGLLAALSLDAVLRRRNRLSHPRGMLSLMPLVQL